MTGSMVCPICKGVRVIRSPGCTDPDCYCWTPCPGCHCIICGDLTDAFGSECGRCGAAEEAAAKRRADR